MYCCIRIVLIVLCSSPVFFLTVGLMPSEAPPPASVPTDICFLGSPHVGCAELMS